MKPDPAVILQISPPTFRSSTPVPNSQGVKWQQKGGGYVPAINQAHSAFLLATQENPIDESS